jgi:hypothetical protein
MSDGKSYPWYTLIYCFSAFVIALFAMLHFNRFGMEGSFPPEIHLLAAVSFFLIGGTCLVYVDVREQSWQTRMWSYMMLICAFAQGGVFTFALSTFSLDLVIVEQAFILATGFVSALAFACAYWIHLRWQPT